MLSFFQRFQKTKSDFGALKTDMHSHLIPGIDDGAKTLEKSLSYIKGLQNLGFERIITTPHIMGDHYPNTSKIILSGLEEVRHALLKENNNVKIEAAAEYYADDFFVDLLDKKEKLLTLPGNRVLIEFSTFASPANALEIIFRLKTMNYQPVLAHPERYVYYADNFSIFREFKNAGCEMQVNLLSLSGHYGVLQKKLAHKLFEEKLADFAGTDLHHGGHLEILTKTLKSNKLQSYLQHYDFQNTIF